MAEAAAPERQLKARSSGRSLLPALALVPSSALEFFALAGTAAAGEQAHAHRPPFGKTPVMNFFQAWITHAPLVFGRPGAGPAVTLSFIVAGIACGFRRALLRGIWRP